MNRLINTLVCTLLLLTLGVSCSSDDVDNPNESKSRVVFVNNQKYFCTDYGYYVNTSASSAGVSTVVFELFDNEKSTDSGVRLGFQIGKHLTTYPAGTDLNNILLPVSYCTFSGTSTADHIQFGKRVSGNVTLKEITNDKVFVSFDDYKVEGILKDQSYSINGVVGMKR